MKEDKNTKKHGLISRIFKPVKAQENSDTSEKPTKHSQKLINFVKAAIEQNAGDYADISAKLAVINLFCDYAKSVDENVNFAAMKEFYTDFFTGNTQINSFNTINNFIANYSKIGDEKYSIKNVRGVSVAMHEKFKLPVIYFGQRKEWAEDFDKDTYLMFDASSVMLYDCHMEYYDEIPLLGHGTIAQFDFDKQNRLANVQYRYLENPRLGFWSDFKQINFEKGYYV